MSNLEEFVLWVSRITGCQHVETMRDTTEIDAVLVRARFERGGVVKHLVTSVRPTSDVDHLLVEVLNGVDSAYSLVST